MNNKIVTAIAIVGGLMLGGLGLYGLANKEPVKYSLEWIKRLSPEQWAFEREIVRQKFCSSEYSEKMRIVFQNILSLFDKVKSERDWTGKIPQGPAFHREHGWYL